MGTYRIYYCLHHDDIIIKSYQNQESHQSEDLEKVTCTDNSTNCTSLFLANAHLYHDKWVFFSDNLNKIEEKEIESLLDKWNGGITLSIIYHVLNDNYHKL